MDAESDLDKLAAALAPRTVPANSSLRSWLEVMADRDASDLLLIAGEPPALRVNGRIVRTGGATLDGVAFFPGGAIREGAGAAAANEAWCPPQ